ncbi:uncharacterized protein LOC113582553 [Electrophorus electricus]|uniref:uncharacterized protein LOC113582553 n=1 Tax=Electrophorus electricus TaxID=8005 RepID=UPI0015D0308C|nr:uncharacterized protein LOC113582553 [Electrophorus electricus]
MREELRTVEEVNKNLSSDLTTITDRLRHVLKQLHELEAESLIQNSQITLLENEQLQLIGEKENLMDVFDHGNQAELRELRETCCKLS